MSFYLGPLKVHTNCYRIVEILTVTHKPVKRPYYNFLRGCIKTQQILNLLIFIFWNLYLLRFCDLLSTQMSSSPSLRDVLSAVLIGWCYICWGRASIIQLSIIIYCSHLSKIYGNHFIYVLI